MPVTNGVSLNFLLYFGKIELSNEALKYCKNFSVVLAIFNCGKHSNEAIFAFQTFSRNLTEACTTVGTKPRL